MSDMVKFNKENIISCLFSLGFDRVDRALLYIIKQELEKIDGFYFDDEALSVTFFQYAELSQDGVARIKDSKTPYSEISYDNKVVKIGSLFDCGEILEAIKGLDFCEILDYKQYLIENQFGTELTSDKKLLKYVSTKELTYYYGKLNNDEITRK